MLARASIVASRFGVGPISVMAYGAVGDGVTDDTAAIQAALTAARDGSIVFFPIGLYKITDELSISTGMILEGSGSATNLFGVPSARDLAQQGTQIWQATAGKAVFLFDCRAASTTKYISDVTIRDMALSAKQDMTADTTPDTNNKYGIKAIGTWPYGTQRVVFERLTFCHFQFGIYISDTAHDTYDWNFAPASFRNLQFNFCEQGIAVISDNFDACVLDTCNWSIPQDGIGINLVRSGFLTLLNCIAGGSGVGTNSTWLYLDPATCDNVKVIGCQAESLTWMVRIKSATADNLSNTYNRLMFDNCIFEAPVSIENTCGWISTGCKYLTASPPTCSATYTSIDSILDAYESSTAAWTFPGSPANSSVRTNIATQYKNASGTSYPTDPAARKYTTLNNKRFIEHHTSGYPVLAADGSFLAGDVVWNKNTLTGGAPVGWVCTVAGAPGTWSAFGQCGGLEAPGSPLGLITPPMTGSDYLDTTDGVWYKAVGTTSDSWVSPVSYEDDYVMYEDAVVTY